MSTDTTSPAPIDLPHLRSWIGRSETREDTMPVWAATAVQATLRDDPRSWRPGDCLPPLWHWCYFLAAPPLQALGADGLPAQAAFMPAVPLPRRMWAGSTLTFHAGVPLGQPARKTSRVADVQFKQGRSGALVFVSVEHEVCNAAGQLLLSEAHEVVYREAAGPGEAGAAAAPAPAGAEWTVVRRPDPTLLFRYSALTFNSHRIHYDHPYATQVEGYDGLVVHGPLLATLLLEAAQAQHPGRTVRSYRFRAMRPAFCERPLRLHGRPLQADGSLQLWAQDDAGALLMQAQARLA